MLKFKLSLRLAAALILVAATGVGYAQTATLRGRAVVKAMVTFPRIITTIAGSGPEIGPVSGRYAGDGGPATEARLNGPWDLAMDDAGNLYIADQNNGRIRKVDAKTGIITTVAGGGAQNGDGIPATQARTGNPRGIFVDGAGNIYIGQIGGGVLHQVRKVDANTGIITTIAGTGGPGFSGDGGPATQASLNFPLGVFVDGLNNIYIADSNNHRVRKVDARTGIITTVAGNGTAGFSGDGGPATQASLSSSRRIFVDSLGNIYISDDGNRRVRKVDANTGVITTVAGNGAAGFSGDGGPATEARLSGVVHVFVDKSGNLYIVTTGSQYHRVRKVDANTGIITTVAGNGTAGFSGDGGPATAASLNTPMSVIVDDSGNLYIADRDNNRIRKVTPPKPAAGLVVEFSRAISGRARDYRWKGTVNADGQVEVEITAEPPRFGPANASGYYVARAIDPASGAVVAAYGNIPINGGREYTLDLVIGDVASVVGTRPLETPAPFTLGPNYPNPFNPATQIAYELPEAAEVRLAIYNALGQEVRTLVQGRQEAGYYRVTWDGKDAAGRSVSSGLYFYRLMGSGFAETRKMLLLK